MTIEAAAATASADERGSLTVVFCLTVKKMKWEWEWRESKEHWQQKGAAKI